MGKKKILFIITQGSSGGAQRYVFDLATNLTADFNVAVAVGEKKGKQDLQKKITNGNERLTNKIRVIQLRHLVRRISPVRDILSVFELANLYNKEKPDIVHLNSSKAGIIGSIAKLLTTYPPMVIYTVHGWIFQEPMARIKRQFYIWLEKLTAKLKNQIIVLSRAEAEIAEQTLQIPEDKIKIIPPGLTPAPALNRETAKREILKRANLPADAKWVVTIANFFPTKGLDILIESIALNKNTLADIQFVIIGDGQDRKTLEKKISVYNLGDQIHLLGYIENAASLLSAFDLMVIPSRKEGLPYAALEAISAELPIVATKTGGLTELIKNEQALAAPDNARELGKKITDALRRPPKIETKISSLAEMTAATTAIYRQLSDLKPDQ